MQYHRSPHTINAVYQLPNQKPSVTSPFWDEQRKAKDGGRVPKENLTKEEKHPEPGRAGDLFKQPPETLEKGHLASAPGLFAAQLQKDWKANILGSCLLNLRRLTAGCAHRVTGWVGHSSEEGGHQTLS